MPASPGYVGTPLAGQPFRLRHMPGDPGLARTRADRCRPWDHLPAKEEEGRSIRETQGI